MKRTFTRKGYGRIIVDSEQSISKVKQIIKEMDAFEYKYLPNDFIVDWDHLLTDPSVVYTHKFDELDINKLTIRCFMEGINIFCLDNGHDEYFKIPDRDSDTEEEE